MNYHRLRIAWSVFWGVAAVLLVVLWVRSYGVEDVLIAPGDGSRRLSSGRGWVTARWMEPAPLGLEFKTWHHFSQPRRATQVKMRPPHFGLIDSGAIQLPYWLATALCAGSLGLGTSKMTTQFSLRSLLIATTLVALVLGLIVWASR